MMYRGRYRFDAPMPAMEVALTTAGCALHFRLYISLMLARWGTLAGQPEVDREQRPRHGIDAMAGGGARRRLHGFSSRGR